MPNLTVDAYLSHYDERADLVYDLSEWGTNRYGKRSHAIAPGEGAQWDPTRQVQFMPAGTTNHMLRDGGMRIIPGMPCEGPHTNGATFIFVVPLGNVTVDDAHLELSSNALFCFWNATPLFNPSGMTALRVYAVASDNWVSRWLAPTYPATYKSMFFPRQFGTQWNRRYRVDSYQEHQEHVDAQTEWTDLPTTVLSTPDVTAMVRAILARPGWKSGNRMLFYVIDNEKPKQDPGSPWTGAPWPPDLDTYAGGGGNGFLGCDNTDPLKRPKLVINYH